MYHSLPSLVLGFHGCDRAVGEAVVRGPDRLEARPKAYDWLGHGIYFWENSPERALEWAREKQSRPASNPSNQVSEPYVIGAVLDLGNCFNLLEARALSYLKSIYESFVTVSSQAGNPLPENRPFKIGADLIFRHLDCAVIEYLHAARKESGEQEYDTVRGVFFEGDDLYENAGFKEKNHIQICVRNPNCIKGYFRVLDPA